MKATVLSDNEPTGQRVRQLLSCRGYECPAYPGTAEGVGDADLCVLVLSPTPQRGLALLPELRRPVAGAHPGHRADPGRPPRP